MMGGLLLWKHSKAHTSSGWTAEWAAGQVWFQGSQRARIFYSLHDSGVSDVIAHRSCIATPEKKNIVKFTKNHRRTRAK
jgi:hypothetical protein